MVISSIIGPICATRRPATPECTRPKSVRMCKTALDGRCNRIRNRAPGCLGFAAIQRRRSDRFRTAHQCLFTFDFLTMAGGGERRSTMNCRRHEPEAVGVTNDVVAAGRLLDPTGRMKLARHAHSLGRRQVSVLKLRECEASRRPVSRAVRRRA